MSRSRWRLARALIAAAALAVLAANNRGIVRLEEIRVETRATSCVVSEYVIGLAGLAERLGVGVRLVFGRRVGVRVARWDQLDIQDPHHPRLICPVEELRTE